MRVFLQAVCKDKAIQEIPEKMEKENAEFDPSEEMKEAFAAFRSVFFDMKIENIFAVGRRSCIFLRSRPPRGSPTSIPRERR